MTAVRGHRWAAATSVAGTVFIAAGAFWLSFTALADLARRSGIDARLAWAWPLIVDGVIVVSTVAVVALAGERAAWYPWVLLIGGAAVSVTGNSLHAVVAADADVSPALAAAVAAVPPVVLLAITHLTAVVTRTRQYTGQDATTELSETNETFDGATCVGSHVASASSPATPTVVDQTATPAQTPPTTSDTDDRAAVPPESTAVRRERAAGLREAGWSNKQIAREIRVHPSTVGRWFANDRDFDEAGRDDRGSVLQEATP